VQIFPGIRLQRTTTGSLIERGRGSGKAKQGTRVATSMQIWNSRQMKAAKVASPSFLGGAKVDKTKAVQNPLKGLHTTRPQAATDTVGGRASFRAAECSSVPK
jgi:hypothetical protein